MILGMFLKTLIVFQQFLILFIVLYLLNQQFFECKFRLNDLLFNIPKDARVYHPLCPILLNFSPLFLNILSNPISLPIQLPKVIFILLKPILQAN